MSLGRAIFSRVWGGLIRRARAQEEAGGRIIENFKLLRRYLFYGGSLYCTGSLFRYWVLDHASAEGVSMYPTMAAKTPFTLISKRHDNARNMSPGDIVNFISPVFKDQDLGKRIIGVQGDFIVLDPHQAPSVGGAFIPGITDWRSQSEIKAGVELRERQEPMMIEIPQGHIYAVGDNMSWSRDSRFFGPVPMALVKGKQIMHWNTGHGFQWTYGDQLRKIPKEEEEEYLRGWRQSQTDNKKVAEEKMPASTSNKPD